VTADARAAAAVAPAPSTARLLVGAAIPTTACVFPAFLVGAVALQVREDLDFSTAGVGLSVGAFFAAASVTSALLGRLAERVGPTRALWAASLWSAAAQVAVAGLARSFALLLALLAVAGAANALAQPAANVFVARYLPAHRQGLAFAVKQSAVPASTLVAGLAVPAIALTVGWRWAFVAGAALAVTGAATVPRVESAIRSERARRPTPKRSPSDAPLAVMAVLAVGIGLGAAAAGTLGAFLVSAGVHSGMSESASGLLLTMGSCVGIAVRVWAGVRADKRDGGHLRVVALMLAGGSVAFAALATGVPWVYLVAIPVAFGAGWAWPGLFNLAVVRANPGAPGIATGITQTGTYFGAVAGPLLFGVVADRASFAWAWLLASATALLAAGAIVLGRRLLRASRLAEPAAVLPA
jgi:MFS family permease